ncbi:unnamed protein product [Urochloa decumbens]|uniref:Uncharacterized protein n=1 Tax=Urochloa decumbens TaxID=240449 RepID=A0ABC9CT55_9POAL
MDKATTSVCSSRNSEMPEETGMQQIASELQALKRLYGLLHKGSADENLDETSKTLMLKMLDDATQQALLKQAKMLSGSLMSPVLERKLSIRSDRRTLNAEPRQRLSPIASPSPSPSLLAAGERPSRLNPQYSTVSSRPGDGHVDGHRQAAEEPLLARLPSYRSSRTTASALPPRHRPGGGEQRNSGLSLYRLPVVAATSRHGTVAATSQHGTVAATSQHGTVAGRNRRSGRRDMRRHGSSRGGRSSLPEGGSSSSGQHSVSREVSLGQARRRVRGTDSSTRRFGRLDSGLSLSVASRRGSERAGRRDASPEQSSSSNTVATIRSRIRPNQDHKEHRLRRQAEEEKEESTPRRGSTDTDASVSASTDHGDRSSPEGSSRRSSVSRELSLGRARLHGRSTTSRHEGGGEGSCSTRRFGRSRSGLSLGLASRRGSTRAGRGVASRERHSSSNTKASRTRPKPSLDIKERSLRRAQVEEGESSRRRERTDSSVCSGGRLPRRTLKRIDSGSMYMSRSSRNSSRAAISCPSTSPTVSPEPSTSAASYSPPQASRRGMAPPVSRRDIPPPPVSWRGPPPPQVSMRGVAPPPPVYAPRTTRSMRRRRRLEVLEKRVGRLRMLKSKIAMVFHHRHDHHHHFGRGGQEEGPSSRAIPGEHHRGSPWGFLGEMFHHRTEHRGKEKTTSRMVIGGAPPAKKRGGGGGNIHALFDAVRRHLRDKRRKPATASVKMRRTANRSRTLAKKMHWWQRLKQRRGRKEVAAGRPRRRLGLGKF